MANQFTMSKYAYSSFSYKMSVYRLIMNRAFFVCTENNSDNELDNNCRIASKNGFQVQHIHKLTL